MEKNEYPSVSFYIDLQIGTIVQNILHFSLLKRSKTLDKNPNLN